jgi:hypothetical protein
VRGRWTEEQERNLARFEAAANASEKWKPGAYDSGALEGIRLVAPDESTRMRIDQLLERGVRK